MMKARILSLFLALTLLTGSASPALAAGGYSDVPRDHWAAQSVRRAGELGLFQGVGGGRFGLGEPITRAAFVTALVRLFGWEAERPQSPAFSDVPAGAWYFSAKAARASMICRPIVYSAWKPILWLICRVTSSFRRRKSFSTPSTVPLKLLMLSQNT